MNKKAIALLSGIIVTIGIIAVVTYQINSESNQAITVTYTTHPIVQTDYWWTSNTTLVTNIVVNALFNSSKYSSMYIGGFDPTTNINNPKDFILNMNDFYLTSNGQPLSTYILGESNETRVNTDRGVAVMRTLDFTIRGIVTSYQLAYNGTAKIKIAENP